MSGPRACPEYSPTYYAAFQYDATAPRSFAASSTGYGTLGYALPAAFGAKLGAPDRPVVAFAGEVARGLPTAVTLAGMATFLWKGMRPRHWWLAERARSSARRGLVVVLMLFAVLSAVVFVAQIYREP